MLHGIEDRIEMIITVFTYIDENHPYRLHLVDILSCETCLVPRTIKERYVTPFFNAGYFQLTSDDKVILTTKGKDKLDLMKNRHSPQEQEKERNING